MSVFWRLVLACWVCMGLAALSFGCGPSAQCENGISTTRVNPDGSFCDKDCDCNNQSYMGICESGRCRTVKRESCEVVGAQKTCIVPDFMQKGGCREGTAICKDKGLDDLRWGDCVLKPTDELCNGQDDDCDGAIDEALFRPCYSGSQGCTRPAEGMPYTCVAPCASGKQICTKGSWGACEGERISTIEQCNGTDDDCDGEIDEDLNCTGECKDGETRACYQGAGGCLRQADGSYQCKGECKAGTQRCTGGTWDLCTGGRTAQAKTCDGKDNDCDGQVDTGCNETCKDGASRPCYLSSASGCAKQSDGSYKCQGRCKAGTQTCKGTSWGLCEGMVTPRSTEQCNGFDDDCNGAVDDNIDLKKPLSPSPALCTNQVGVCRLARTTRCQSGKWDTACTEADFKARSADYKAVDDLCDDKDNDCDNSVDESAANCAASLAYSDSINGGYADGPPGKAEFQEPAGITIDAAGNLYIADTGNHCIRKMDTSLLVTTIAGKCKTSGNANGATLTQARLFEPHGLVISGDDLYIADTENHCIRKLDKQGQVSTLAGVCGTKGRKDGAAAQALFNKPHGLSLFGGALYIADASNHAIRKLDKAGNVSTVAGTGVLGGYKDGPVAQAQFRGLRGLAFSKTGELYIADTYNYCIRKLNAALTQVSTVAGECKTTGHRDGRGTVARFETPASLAVDAVGNLIVLDTLNNCVRKVDATGQVTSVTNCGNTLNYYFRNGPKSQAEFNIPEGIVIDSAGNIFITDSGNHAIRKLTP